MKLTSDQAKGALLPSLKQIIFMALFGLAILTLVNISLISFHFTEGTILSKNDVQASFATQLQSWFSSPILSKITLVVFWVGIGLFAYAILYWVYNIFTEAKNEVIVEQEYTNLNVGVDKKKWPVIEAGLYSGMVVLAILTVTLLFPLWSSWYVNFIYDIPSNLGRGALFLLGSFVGIFINIYLFKSLVGLMLVLE